MGADIKVDNGTAVISGVETLSGAPSWPPTCGPPPPWCWQP